MKKQEKILKENLFNRIFHNRQLCEQRQKVWEARMIICGFHSFEHAITECDELTGMMSIHKDMWGSGYQNRNIAPDPCGMFRTVDIAEMRPDEVFLGDIYGLWTHNITEWERHREEPFGANAYGIDPEKKTYQIILEQYRSHLLSNLRNIRDEAKEYLNRFPR